MELGDVGLLVGLLLAFTCSILSFTIRIYVDVERLTLFELDPPSFLLDVQIVPLEASPLCELAHS